MKKTPINESGRNRVYLQFPLRKSRFDPKIMKIFYICLGLFWIGTGIWFYMANPDSTIMFPIIYGIIGVFILILANYYDVLFSGKYIDYTDEGMMIKLNYQKPVFWTWEQIGEVRLEDKHFLIVDKDGGKYEWKIGKSALYNWSDFIRSLRENLARKNISYSL